MTVTVNLEPDVEARLRGRADEAKQDFAAYMEALVERIIVEQDNPWKTLAGSLPDNKLTQQWLEAIQENRRKADEEAFWHDIIASNPARLSVHDNLVTGYEVLCEERRIRLRTAFRDVEPEEVTDVVFDDVLAYHFEGDCGVSILFDIVEAPLETIYHQDEALFVRLKNYGWPCDYGATEQLFETAREAGVTGFAVTSSYGMTGWIWARTMTKVPRAAGLQESERLG